MLFASEHSSSPLKHLDAWLAKAPTERPALTNQAFARAPLSKAEAGAALAALWQDHAKQLRESRAAEWRDEAIVLQGLTMKFKSLSFGDTNALPPNGRSLFISLHGGGNTAKSVNDGQWQNQIKLGAAYKPAEGIYIAPRGPTDTWNLWHESHIDDFFARLIEDAVLFEKVDANRVYVLGYSAGGDGVYQLAPRMADRWAAASMMAGHPNEASPLGLRNVPFAIQVGANDGGFKRNQVAVEWGKKLDALAAADPGAYVHFVELHEGKGHWMELKDRQAIPWMEKFTRNPVPKKVVWFQDDVTHRSCYWLARPTEDLKAGQLIKAECAGQSISLESTNVTTVEVRLNDALVNLDQPVVIRVGDRVLSSNVPPRTISWLAETLAEKGDTNLAFSAAVKVRLTAE
ncbi:MAG: hypothetical protein RLY20_2977 [Verrucomicrobiota bacterium]